MKTTNRFCQKNKKQIDLKNILQKKAVRANTKLTFFHDSSALKLTPSHKNTLLMFINNVALKVGLPCLKAKV
jgi:hypothetical protein